MEKIKLGFLGLGQRGNGLLTNVLNNFPEVEVVALCDEYADRVEDCIKRVEDKRGMPIDIPDFTNGKWILREPKDVARLV